MNNETITVVGAGVLGLWQALSLARTGRRVRLIEASATPFAESSSKWAGVMIAPDCEAELAPRIVRDEGRLALDIWRTNYPDVRQKGTLVVAASRDFAELQRLARVTERRRTIDRDELATLEPDLAGRFINGLFFDAEAHMNAIDSMVWLLQSARDAGVDVCLATRWLGETTGLVIDCRGYTARDVLPSLRGVRGERILVQAPHVSVSRPVRLLHPRHPIYIVPQGDGRYVIGATVIERDDDSPMTVKSALELLGSAYALHPGFAEAEIIEMGAGVRPAYPDNSPRITIDQGGRIIRVNGAYRHGFLLAPVLAKAVCNFISTGEQGPFFA
ncbi:MAG: FAD-dependent oxidoreductase [Hyphomicrobium sp.]